MADVIPTGLHLEASKRPSDRVSHALTSRSLLVSTPAERRGTAKKAIAAFADAIRYRRMQLYEPASYERPAQLLSRYSAWRGLEYVIGDIITRFGVKTDSCLEFGVEFGFSAVVFANYFEKVVGVDLFTGDRQAGLHDDHFASTAASLSAYRQIRLAQADYREWIRSDAATYDLGPDSNQGPTDYELSQRLGARVPCARLVLPAALSCAPICSVRYPGPAPGGTRLVPGALRRFRPKREVSLALLRGAY